MKLKILRLFLSIVLLSGLTACFDKDSDENTGDSQSKDNTEVVESDQEAEEDIDDLFAEVKNNSPTHERIKAFEDIAMHYYWYGGDLNVAEEEIFKGITLHGDYDVVEEAFQQASVLDPYDQDLKYSLASAHILQKEISKALDTYEEILNFDEDHFEAQLMHAIYSKVEGNKEDFESGFKKLEDINRTKAKEYEKRVDLVEDTKDVTLETEVSDDLAKENHAFVVLGYALSEEGEMEDTLIERLKVAKEAAEEYPDSKIIVSGGVPKEGNTEAGLMYDWLVEEGIDKERIFKEDMATDTVENALFSMDIAKDEEVKDITVISSTAHMRRALVIFNEVSEMMEKKGDPATNRHITNTVYMDFENEEEVENVSEDEELVIYRDLIRATGIWQFPGLQR